MFGLRSLTVAARCWPAALTFCLLLQAETVSPLHPRILLRHDAARIGKGLKVSELRQRVDAPAFRRWRRPLADRKWTAVVERAARYLETGDLAELAAVREFLLTRTFSYEKHDVSGFLAGAEMATAYDWVHGALSEVDRAAAMANIVTTTESSRNFLEHGEPDINHNYTYMALHTVAVCGLALKGEAEPYGSKAKEYLALARRFIEGPGRVLDTWNAREGAWAEGSHYTFHETLRNLVMMFAAYRTASDVDYFALTGRKYGDFLKKSGRFLIGSTRPDLTFERIGDCTPNRVIAGITVPVTVDILAWGLGDKREAARLRSFTDAIVEAYGDRAVHGYYEWGMRLFHQPRAPRTPSYRTLPLTMRMGAGTVEHILFRDGWGPESTSITILAGDHFTDHQHFDKGHFLIYRRGGLTIDGGAYDELYKPNRHWNEYASRTLAHNCLLVYDPAQSFPKGYSNDGGQQVLRGKQHHGDWQEYLAHREKEGLDTAHVTAFDTGDAGAYRYVRIDLKSAYGEKVSRYDRQFVYLPEINSLVVFDRVTAARPEFAKRWLLHFEDRPEVDGHQPPPGVTKYPGGVLTTVRRSGEFDLGARKAGYDGALFVRTLAPEQHDIVVTGGPGYEFFNPFSEVNFPLSIPQRGIAPREPGAWRIEVAPAQAAAHDQFLHVLEMADPSLKEPAAAERIGGFASGVTGAWIRSPKKAVAVLFAAAGSGGPAKLPVRYEIPSGGPVDHLLTELPAGRKVIVAVNGKRQVRRVNNQGLLRFRDSATGRRAVAVE